MFDPLDWSLTFHQSRKRYPQRKSMIDRVVVSFCFSPPCFEWNRTKFLRNRLTLPRLAVIHHCRGANCGLIYYFHSYLIGCFISISRHFPLARPSATAVLWKTTATFRGKCGVQPVDSGRKLAQLQQEVQILLFEKTQEMNPPLILSGNGCWSEKDRMWVYSWNNKQILLPHFGPLTFTHTPSPTSLFSLQSAPCVRQGKKWRKGPQRQKNLLVHRL